MTDNPKYSVIIPVYNAEKTLHRCVDSLLNQNYPDAEIILVNDGASDSSGEICAEYAKKHECIVYIQKENGGVSTARNAGLDAARGAYVLFVDSDDFVPEEYFCKLDDLGSDMHYDCIFFSHTVVDGNTHTVKALKPFSSTKAEECVPLFCEALYRKWLSHPINKRYVREIIEENHLRFPEDLSIGEDKTFSLKYVLNCKSCRVSPESLYYVSVENKNSLSRGVRPDLAHQLELLTATIRKTLQEAKIPEEYRAQYIAAENLMHMLIIT